MPIIPQRPSTSGGPSSRKASHSFSHANANWKSGFDNKRLSKDDMFLSSRAAASRPAPNGIGNGSWVQLPREGGPLSSSPVPISVSTSRSGSLLSPQSMSSGEIPIGMALGSPSHPPAVYSSWQPQTHLQRVNQDVTSPASTESVQTPTGPPLQRQKSRRKLFGLFGGKKTVDTAKQAPVPALIPIAANSVTVITSTSISQSASNGAQPTRSNTTSQRKTPRYKPIIIRSNTEPMGKEPVPEYGSNLSERDARQPWGRGRERLPEAPQPSISISPVPSCGSSSGPLLDVEIPTIRMERYSVMFGSLLNPQPASSLLARRQATLDRLKTINDTLAREEHEEKAKPRPRRATSPQPTKSPAFSLFPPTPGRQGNSPPTPRKLSPLSRSNTSPAILPSPSKANFDREVRGRTPGKGKTVTIISPKQAEQQQRNLAVRPDQTTRGHPHVPSPNSTYRFNPGESGLILDSPVSDFSDGEAEFPDPQPLRPRIPEPQWQMITPPSSEASSAGSLPRASPVSSTASSSAHTATTLASATSTATTVADDAESVLSAAVEISIARQISVSRDQRQMLRPLQTSISRTRSATAPISATGSTAAAIARANAGVTPATASALKKNALGRNDRVVETRFATPTLVVPRATVDSQLRQHRKSERVVLEAA